MDGQKNINYFKLLMFFIFEGLHCHRETCH